MFILIQSLLILINMCRGGEGGGGTSLRKNDYLKKCVTFSVIFL